MAANQQAKRKAILAESAMGKAKKTVKSQPDKGYDVLICDRCGEWEQVEAIPAAAIRVITTKDSNEPHVVSRLLCSKCLDRFGFVRYEEIPSHGPQLVT
jgi:predicted Fe-Mo cluster-binding NifX family protein